MREYAGYVLGLVSMILFAYITSFYPQHSWTFFIIYFILMMAFTFATTGRSASRTIRDLEYVKGGTKLLEAKKHTVQKAKLNDPMLVQELKGQSALLLLSFVPVAVFMAIVLVPGLRDAIMNGLSGYFRGMGERMSLFLSYLVFYLLFYITSLGTSLITRVYYSRQGGMLVIPSTYTVTERGIIIDGRTPITFPLKNSDLRVDQERRFVEVRVRAPLSGGAPVSRLRLYHPQVMQLYKILKERLSPEEG